MKLIDVCVLIVDCPHSTAKDEGRGIPLVRTPNIGKGRLELNGVHRVNETVYNQRIERAIPEAGDLILAREAPVGNVALILPGQKVCLGQRVVLIRPDKEKADAAFLTYYLLSDKVQHRLKNNANGAVVAHLNMNEIRNLEIDLPDLSEQKRIASVLSSLDDKIALNNRINHNLVEQAKAMYKSWFIDFEPFKSLDFTDSDFGMVPAVWQIRRAEELCPINIGKTPPRKESQWFSSESSDPVWVSISDMSDCGVYIDDSSEKLTNDAIRRFNVIIVPADSVLLSFKLTIGRVAIANRSLTTNEAIARFVTNDKRLSVFLYLTLLSYDYSKLGSTSSIATAVNSKIVKAMPILWPGKDVVTQFAGSVVPLFDEINKRQAENRCLVALRDTMLPKLMTGQLTCLILIYGRVEII